MICCRGLQTLNLCIIIIDAAVIGIVEEPIDL